MFLFQKSRRHQRCLHIVERKVTGGHSEKATFCKPRSETSGVNKLLTPWLWTSNLQNCERINFRCLSCQVCSILLGKHQWINITNYLNTSYISFFIHKGQITIPAFRVFVGRKKYYIYISCHVVSTWLMKVSHTIDVCIWNMCM